MKSKYFTYSLCYDRFMTFIYKNSHVVGTMPRD